MTNNLLLHTGGRMPETEAEQKADLDAWMALYGHLGNSLVDGGNPTTPMGRTIASDGTVSDAALGMMPSGYSITKANSLDGVQLVHS